MVKRRVTLAIVAALALAGCQHGHTDPEAVSAAETIGLESTLRLADAALAGGDVNSAMALYQQTTQQFPESTRARAAFADALLAVGAHPEAEAAYQNLDRAEPGQPEAPLGLGRVALAEGRTNDAMNVFETALRTFPKDPRLMNGLAVAYDYHGRHAEAQSLYRQILQMQPANRAVSNNLALSLMLTGATDEALERFTGLAAGPTLLPQARYNLALVYGVSGDEAAARDLLQPALGRQATEENLRFYRMLAGATTARR
ncbi:MAG: tetratricopeptide repeat protein [Pseudomonadota bacterium]